MSSRWMTMCLLTLAACGGDSDGPSGGSYALGSVVIDPDDNRITYVQVIDSLEGTYDTSNAIEMPGNGVVMSHGDSIYVGLAEEPTWVKYSLDANGALAETGRLSLLNTGAAYIDYGNAIVNDTTAVTVLSEVPSAVVWDPSTMTITGEIDLSALVKDGLSLEVWTTVAQDGLVYVPGRYANWDSGTIFPGVSMTIIDPSKMTVVATATSDRCASGGRAVFDKNGDLYVMGDGRNYSIQMFANAAGTPEAAPDNCLLRIKKGQTSFDPDFYVSIPSLTGGRQSITELETPAQGSGFAYSKMFYPDELPAGVEATDFAFWDMPVHKMWRIELGDQPEAVEVGNAPFASVGFNSTELDGSLYNGNTIDGLTDVYEIDPDTNTMTKRFSMEGYFYGVFRLTK